MKSYWKDEVKLYQLLHWALDCAAWSASQINRFKLAKQALVLNEEWPARALKPVWRLKNNSTTPNAIKCEVNKEVLNMESRNIILQDSENALSHLE
jgi:hypothetical protein